MMVKLRHVNNLVEHKVVYLPIPRMVKCEDAADCLKRLQNLLWVIPNNFHWLVIALYNQGASPRYSRIGMRVKLQTGF
jgi:hypothetical protein